MALGDPTQSRTTDFQTSTTDYTAGEEPWNKNIEGYEIDSEQTEASTYQCDWNKWHGLYRNVPELRSTIDVHSKWVVGKKLIMSNSTKKIVDRWKGNGLDTARKITEKGLSKIIILCFHKNCTNPTWRQIGD